MGIQAWKLRYTIGFVHAVLLLLISSGILGILGSSRILDPRSFRIFWDFRDLGSSRDFRLQSTAMQNVIEGVEPDQLPADDQGELRWRVKIPP